MNSFMIFSEVLTRETVNCSYVYLEYNRSLKTQADATPLSHRGMCTWYVETFEFVHALFCRGPRILVVEAESGKICVTYQSMLHTIAFLLEFMKGTKGKKDTVIRP